MAKINVTQGTAGAYGAGELQLKDKASMSTTLTTVTDNLNTDSQLKLATNLTQVAGTLQIHTDTATYLDAEDASGNNRFTISRDPASQLVTVDFASVPTALTTPVGAIRTATNGSALANVLTFLENGNIGAGTDTPGAKLDVHSAANVITQFNRTGTGKSWIQYLLAGAAKWNTGFDNVNGNFTIYDAIAAADRLVVTNTGNVGIGTSTPNVKLEVSSSAVTVARFNSTFGTMGVNFANSSVDFGVIGSGNNVTPTALADDLGIGTSGLNKSIVFATGTGFSERMRITAAGNVGIGTTAPQSILNVRKLSTNLGTTSELGLLIDNTGSAGTYSQIGFGYSESTCAAVISGFITNGAGATNSALVFATRTSTIGSDAPTERMRITADGYVRLSANSGGIQFNGDTAAANALDDYEEGTWTPTLTPIGFGSGTITVQSPNLCAYTKIGRLVTINGLLEVSAISSPLGNSVNMGGLPFTSNATGTQRSAGTVTAFNLTSGTVTSNMVITSSTTDIVALINAALFQVGSQLYFQLNYTV